MESSDVYAVPSPPNTQPMHSAVDATTTATATEIEAASAQPVAPALSAPRAPLSERFGQILRRRETKSPELRLTRLPRESAAGERAYPFKFTGQAGEYFRVWVVNTFLVLLTLGLWSPWAKIRKRQFMLRHTWVGDANFEFHAQPWPILRGRLIAGALFVVYWFSGNLNPQYAAWVALAVALAAPWLTVSALRFNMTQTSYRNLRFAFDGTARDAFRALWPLVLVGALTVAFPLNVDANQWDARMLAGFIPTVVLMLFYPYMIAAFRLMLLNRSRLGSAALACSTQVRTIYGIYFRLALMGIAMGFVLVLLVALTVWAMSSQFGRDRWLVLPWTQYFFMFLTIAPTLVVLAVMFSYAQSRVVNATFNLTTVANNVRVFSHLRATSLIKNHIINAVAVVFSGGLLIPWAAIRTARLRVESVSLGVYENLNDIIADQATPGAAAADAASDFFGLDISL